MSGVVTVAERKLHIAERLVHGQREHFVQRFFSVAKQDINLALEHSLFFSESIIGALQE
jgi:hypothetical protein